LGGLSYGVAAGVQIVINHLCQAECEDVMLP